MVVGRGSRGSEHTFWSGLVLLFYLAKAFIFCQVSYNNSVPGNPAYLDYPCLPGKDSLPGSPGRGRGYNPARIAYLAIQDEDKDTIQTL